MMGVQDHLDGKTSYYEIEHRMVHKQGSIRWFLARGTALYDPLASRIGWLARTLTLLSARRWRWRCNG